MRNEKKSKETTTMNTHYTYDDNNSSYVIGEMNVIMTSTPACGQPAVGTLTANVIGGEAPYSYFWNTGYVGQTLSGPVGTYVVTVTDATGQTFVSSGDIIVCPPAILNTKFFLQGYYVGSNMMTSVLLNV